jgi:hypothetical protein
MQSVRTFTCGWPGDYIQWLNKRSKLLKLGRVLRLSESVKNVDPSRIWIGFHVYLLAYRDLFLKRGYSQHLCMLKQLQALNNVFVVSKKWR